MTDHSATPWVIPAGEHNAFIICSGDNPDKPGDILMVVRSPAGRRTIASDHQVDANVAMMVKAVNSHDRLMQAVTSAMRLIGAINDTASAAIKESNINTAWHILDDVLASIKETAK